MNIDACFKIGYILKPHGLKGEVTVSFDDDAPADFDGISTVFVEAKGQLVPYFIEALSLRGAKGFLKLEEVDTIDAATAIAKRNLYLQKTDRPKSARGEFYNDEVVGFVVTDADLGDLGAIEDVMQAGANRLLVVKHQGREVLIPVNSPFITSINKSKKRVAVSLPEGFLDI